MLVVLFLVIVVVVVSVIIVMFVFVVVVIMIMIVLMAMIVLIMIVIMVVTVPVVMAVPMVVRYFHTLNNLGHNNLNHVEQCHNTQVIPPVERGQKRLHPGVSVSSNINKQVGVVKRYDVARRRVKAVALGPRRQQHPKIYAVPGYLPHKVKLRKNSCNNLQRRVRGAIGLDGGGLCLCARAKQQHGNQRQNRYYKFKNFFHK